MVVESTLLLPVLFLVVVALFAALAQRMGREMAVLPPLTRLHRQHRRQPRRRRRVWRDVVAAAAAGVVVSAAARRRGAAAGASANPACAGSGRVFGAADIVALLVARGASSTSSPRGALWSPYYKIGVRQEGADTVIDVNNIFHQSMAPVGQKEYFYQWPYTVFGDTFDDVLILGAGSGTDVAAALMHGAKHVDAVEIDPVIIRLGRERHPDRPYSDPRVTVHQRRRAPFSENDDEEIRPRRVCADRFADAPVGLLGRAARELHVHRRSRFAR